LTQEIIVIAAVSANGIIGKNGALPWHLSEDLKRFKRLTQGHTVVMGRRTFESIGSKPFPNRRHVILTRQQYASTKDILYTDKIEIIHTIKDEKIFIIGGGEIYHLFIPLATRLEITHVHQNIRGDTFFPLEFLSQFILIKESFIPSSEIGISSFSFATYRK